MDNKLPVKGRGREEGAGMVGGWEMRETWCGLRGGRRRKIGAG